MARLTEHAVALGKAGARNRWAGVSDADRRRTMERVRAAKKHKGAPRGQS